KTDEVPADEYGVGMLAGLRFGLSERVAFRLDGTVDVMPVTWNANRGVAVRQPDGRYVAKFRGRTHVGLQAGLGVFWNPRQQRVTSPIPIPAEPAPSPAPPAT